MKVSTALIISGGLHVAVVGLLALGTYRAAGGSGGSGVTEVTLSDGGTRTGGRFGSRANIGGVQSRSIRSMPTSENVTVREARRPRQTRVGKGAIPSHQGATLPWNGRASTQNLSPGPGGSERGFGQGGSQLGNPGKGQGPSGQGGTQGPGIPGSSNDNGPLPLPIGNPDPVAEETPTPIPTVTPTPFPTPTPVPTPTPRPTPTSRPTPTPEPEPTPRPRPTATPEPTPTPKPKGETRRAILTKQVNATVPDSLRDADYKSSVGVRFEIAADGSFSVSLRSSSGSGELDDRVLSAARRWRWKPALRDGEAVSSVMNVRVEIVVR